MKSHPIDLRVALHALAQETFRDQADADYISARMNYRMKLREQFLWSSLQACEKYLKAILLFNERSARYVDGAKPGTKEGKRQQFGHDLSLLFVAVRKVTDLPLQKPDWLPDFMDYLTKFGNNRYLSISTYTFGDELRRLDEAVWTLRRLCQDFDWYVGDDEDHQVNTRSLVLAQISNPARRKNPTLDRPLGAIDGYLERVVKRPHRDLARRALVWNNLFFASRQRHRISYRQLSSSENPPQTRDWFRTPAIRDVIEEYVSFPSGALPPASSHGRKA